jgi:hypothetical protein
VTRGFAAPARIARRRIAFRVGIGAGRELEDVPGTTSGQEAGVPSAPRPTSSRGAARPP